MMLDSTERFLLILESIASIHRYAERIETMSEFIAIVQRECVIPDDLIAAFPRIVSWVDSGDTEIAPLYYFVWWELADNGIVTTVPEHIIEWGAEHEYWNALELLRDFGDNTLKIAQLEKHFRPDTWLTVFYMEMVMNEHYVQFVDRIRDQLRARPYPYAQTDYELAVRALDAFDVTDEDIQLVQQYYKDLIAHDFVGYRYFHTCEAFLEKHDPTFETWRIPVEEVKRRKYERGLLYFNPDMCTTKVPE